MAPATNLAVRARMMLPRLTIKLAVDNEAIVLTKLADNPNGWHPIYTKRPFTGLFHFTDTSELPLPVGQARFYKTQFEGVSPNLRLDQPAAETIHVRPLAAEAK